jgi:hypothetical protein
MCLLDIVLMFYFQKMGFVVICCPPKAIGCEIAKGRT